MDSLNELALKNARARFTAANGSVVQTLADYMLEVHHAADVAWNALAEMDISPTVHFAMASIGRLILPEPAENKQRRGDSYTQGIRDLAAMPHVSLEMANVLIDCADIIDRLEKTCAENKFGEAQNSRDPRQLPIGTIFPIDPNYAALVKSAGIEPSTGRRAWDTIRSRLQTVRD